MPFQRYFQQFQTDEQSFGLEAETPFNREDVIVLNMMQSHIFQASLQIHHDRIKNATGDTLVLQNSRMPSGIVMTFNCDPEAAEKDFLAEVQRADNGTQALFSEIQCNPPEICLKRVAKLDFADAVIKLSCPFGYIDELNAQREDFDLKADALAEWRE